MLIPKELEANIVAAVSEAIAPVGGPGVSCAVSGSWQSVTVGLPRWIAAETPDPAHIHVAVGTALPQTFTSGEVDFSVNLSLFIRTDLDPTGEILVAFAEKIEDLLRSWQSQTYQQAFDALDVPGSFVVGDVQGQSGSSPALNGNIFSVSWPLTISGSYP